MTRLLANNYRYRRTYSKVPTVVEVNNLIEIQKRSYDHFLQPETTPEDRDDSGLQAVFKRVFPIEDFGGRASLQFVSYELEDAKYDVDECRERGMTYSKPIKVTVRLVVWDVDTETEQPHRLQHQGAAGLLRRDPADDRERHLHHQRHRAGGGQSQLHRSAGHLLRLQPQQDGRPEGDLLRAHHPEPRVSWIDFEFDSKDILYVRIDRRRKLPATVLLRALGYDTEALLNYFYESERVFRTDEGWFKETTRRPPLLSRRRPSTWWRPDGDRHLQGRTRSSSRTSSARWRKAGMLRKEHPRVIDGRDRSRSSSA